MISKEVHTQFTIDENYTFITAKAPMEYIDTLSLIYHKKTDINQIKSRQVRLLTNYYSSIYAYKL